MDKNNNYKLVLINETKTINPNDIKLDTDSNYVFEGEVAEFDITNENNRIYTKDEYFPHLTYLQEKITKKRLLGELDHPDRFDVKLSNVSHIVEGLSYVPTTNKVVGKFRILDTTMGKEAKAILKGGGILSVSTRSAGVVNESTKKVTIKKIFTIDLVNEPGFKNAQLHSITESLGIMNENLNVYEVSDDFIKGTKDPEVQQFLNETLLEINKLNNHSLINEDNKNLKTKKKVNGSMKDNVNINKSSVVTKDEMVQYSQILKDKFNKMGENVKSLNERASAIDETSNMVNKLLSFNDYMVENFNESEVKLDKVTDYAKYLGNMSDKMCRYMEYLRTQMVSEMADLKESHQEEVKNIKSYSNYLSETLENVIKHNNYLAENLDNTLAYSKYLGNTQEGGMQYLKYVAEQLDKTVGFADYLANNQNDTYNYVSYLGEQLDNSIQHGDYLGENLSKTIDYAKYLGKSIDNVSQYAEYVGENSLPKIPQSQKVNENLSDRISGFVKLVDERQVKKENEKNITGMLSEGSALRFQNLSESEKTKVTHAILENGCINEQQVLKVWEDAISTPQTMRLRMLMEHIPHTVKPVWDSLTESEKNKIQNIASKWDLSSPYKVKDFWMGLNLKPAIKSEVALIKEEVANTNLYKAVNESKKSKNTEVTLGYSMDSVRSKLDILKR